jgi:hypothetical protein
MVEIVWEIIVRDQARGQFELAFGPGGAWSKLFAKSPGFRGTTLMRDLRNSRRYLVVELWNDEAGRDKSISEQQTEYTDLEAVFDEWAESKIELGIFSVRADATVRPRGKAGRKVK